MSNAATITPPASQFAQLLRRSRFASFDPAIRQTYSSPQASAHRGDWGLKRPIALRRKNAFISISNAFESPAQYIEWNNAESQVRFIRRVEEMGTLPRTAVGTPWHKTLGKAKTQWLADSEFWLTSGPIDLKGLGKKGPGSYDAHIMPNINSMSRREFVRYLRTLRALRPAFKSHVKENAAKNPYLKDVSLFGLSQAPSHWGMVYTHPSGLDTYFTAKPQPGLVLQTVAENRRSDRFTRAARGNEANYVASFGGIDPAYGPRLGEGYRPGESGQQHREHAYYAAWARA
ncbi:hypothetical protein BD779DRAFT_1514950 [Infundibulicybe gibba]|nr:hypothetical protein BD779DRAFT_1514950 [Infundibulicybe gibba]